MAKQKVTEKLNIFLNGIHLGVLDYKAKRELSFTYHEEWLARSQCFPISRSLELREETHRGESVYTYFDNLLPDATSIRQRIAARMHADSDQVFDLLAVIGRDCVGALQLINAEDPAPALKKPMGVPLSNSDIAKKLRSLKTIPLAASEEDDFRLSIAGAQEKTAFLKLEDQWYLPIGESPTTHIFKPQIGEFKRGLSFSDSVENEWICAEIVREFGLQVTKCQIEKFEDIKVLVVERFDRQWHKNLLIRVPQEDFCQALGVPSFKKYEVDGGPGVIKMMDTLQESLSAADDRRAFLKAQIIFHLLAAIDGHAKNFSLRLEHAGFQMAPLYDILSAQPMVDKGKFQSEKLKMALAFGKNRHYKMREIYRRHFFETAKLCRFNTEEMEALISETLLQVPGVIERVSEKLDPDFPQDIAESIFKGIKQRVNHFE